MLELISGRTGTGKSAACLLAIKNKLLQEPEGRPIILLLPEHMTYRAERQLASMLAKEGRGFSHCYIYGFRRFAYQVLQETGGALETGLTELGRHLLLKRLLDNRLKAGEESDRRLTAFARAARQRGFVGELSDIINELKSYGIKPDVLQDIAGQLGDGNTRLQGKLRDMAGIYADFNAAMEGRYSDGKDIMLRLVERLPCSQLVQGAELWLDGFVFFNPLEKQILYQLFDLCGDIHVNLTLDTGILQSGRLCDQISRENIFYRCYGTRNYLLELAQEKNIEVREKFLTQGLRYVNPALGAVESQWMNHRLQPTAYKTGIRFVEAAAPRLEIEALAADIVRLVREKNYHWRDIGILLRDEDAYGYLTEMVLQEYSIPFFNAAKRQGTRHPLAELIRSALAICTTRQGWSYDNVFRCLKTGFFKEICNLTVDALDQLENYVLEFGIKGKKVWNQEIGWSYVARRSLEDDGEKTDEEALERARQADGYRRLIAAPIARLEESLHGAAKVQDKERAEALAAGIYAFLIELKVPQQLEQLAQQEEQAGNLAGAREHQQLWKAIMELLDQMVELGSFDGENPLQEFVQVLEEGLDSLMVSLIPPGLDYVSIGSFDQNSLESLKAIFIPGANAGVMPRHSSENVILSDADRIHINEIQAEQGGLSVIGQENSFNEGWLLYKGFNQAREYIWVSWSLSDDSGTGREAAPVSKWLRRLLPQVKLWQILQGEGFVAEAGQSLSGLGRALRHCRDYGTLDEVGSNKWQSVYNWLHSYAGDKSGTALEKSKKRRIAHGIKQMGKALGSRPGADRLPRELAEPLFAPKGWLRGSVTKLESYNKCPFSFYAKYGLGLRERKVSKFGMPDLGNLLHALLKEFGERLKAENRRWSDVAEEQQRHMCHEILQRLAPRLQNNIMFQRKQLEAQLRRIENTAVFALRRLCAFDAVSQLHPEYFEASFGGISKDPNQRAVELVYRLGEHNRLSLNGQIDRIDLTGDGSYFMIMDYKTGQAAINIMDVYYGVRLQLLTYLLVAKSMLEQKQGQATLPVGMLYCFLKKPIASLKSHQESQHDIIQELEKKLRMPGWIVADKELVQLVDSTLQNPMDTSRFISAKLGKNGNLQNVTPIKSQHELDLLLAYIDKILQETGKKILAGEIQPQPYESKSTQAACSYCPYHVICGFDAKLEGFGYRKVPNQKDDELILEIERELAEAMDSRNRPYQSNDDAPGGDNEKAIEEVQD